MARNGIDKFTGLPISDLDHAKQSIVDILTTPIGTRVTVRDYGSHLFKLVDRPVNGSFVSNVYAMTAYALYRWEPDVRVTRIQVDTSSINLGRLALSLEALYVPDGKTFTLDGILVQLKP